MSPPSVAAVRKENEQILAVLHALTDTAYAPLYTAVAALPQKREELCRILRLLHTALRDLTLLCREDNPPLIFFTSPDAIPEPLKGFRINTLIAFADATESTIEALIRNANITTAEAALVCRFRSAQKEKI